MPRTLKLLLAVVLFGGSAVAVARSGAPSKPRPVRKVAQATPATPAQPAPPAPATPALPAQPPAGEVEAPVKQRSNLSGPEMLAQGKDYVKKMGDVLKRVETLQAEAKKQKDIIKLNGVTDKLVQIKVNVNIAEGALTALEDAVRRNDMDAATHEFTRLTIIYQKVTLLGTEAENVVGEDLNFVGSTKVDTEIDPDIPPDDMTQSVPPPRLDVDRPPEASIYM